MRDKIFTKIIEYNINHENRYEIRYGRLVSEGVPVEFHYALSLYSLEEVAELRDALISLLAEKEYADG